MVLPGLGEVSIAWGRQSWRRACVLAGFCAGRLRPNEACKRRNAGARCFTQEAKIMKAKLLLLLLLAGSSSFARTRFFVGIGAGPEYGYSYAYAPPPPPPIVVYAPHCPGPGYTWVDGYWYPVGPRYHWRAGYWSRPPYYGARWVAPRYAGHRYYRGYWRR
jgi:hypothetical protein